MTSTRLDCAVPPNAIPINANDAVADQIQWLANKFWTDGAIDQHQFEAAINSLGVTEQAKAALIDLFNATKAKEGGKYNLGVLPWYSTVDFAMNFREDAGA